MLLASCTLRVESAAGGRTRVVGDPQLLLALELLLKYVPPPPGAARRLLDGAERWSLEVLACGGRGIEAAVEAQRGGIRHLLIALAEPGRGWRFLAARGEEWVPAEGAAELLREAVEAAERILARLGLPGRPLSAEA